MDKDGVSISQENEMNQETLNTRSLSNSESQDEVASSVDFKTYSSSSQSIKDKKALESLRVKKLLYSVGVFAIYSLFITILSYKSIDQNKKISSLEKEIETTYQRQKSLTNDIHKFMKAREVLQKLEEQHKTLAPTDHIDYVLFKEAQDEEE